MLEDYTFVSKTEQPLYKTPTPIDGEYLGQFIEAGFPDRILDLYYKKEGNRHTIVTKYGDSPRQRIIRSRLSE